jgi:RNA polymerase sigma-70 factor (ECF subfamily)
VDTSGLGDTTQFEAWYRGQQPKLATALMALSGDPGLARDATDEAFVRAFERWSLLSTMDSPEAWVYRTGVNIVRRRARRAALEQRILRRSSAAPNQIVPGWDLDLLAAIHDLPPRQRTAVALHYIADLSVDDTAAAMRVKRGTVLATIHAARASLRETLSTADEETTR